MNQPQRSLTSILLISLFTFTIFTGIMWSLCRPAENGLQGVYYLNETWEAPSILTVLDAEPSKATLKAHRTTHFGEQAFSVEWTGHIDIPKTGIYTFFTESDDGSYLFIDNILVVDNGGAHGLLAREGRIFLRQGFHQLKLRYFDIGGYTVLRVFWQQEHAPKTLLTSQDIIPPMSITRLWIFQQIRAILPFLAGAWGLALFYGILAAHIYLRRREHSRYAVSSIFARSSIQILAKEVVLRVFVQPAMFARQILRSPQAWYWIAVVSYCAVIFFTLSYVRKFSTKITDLYGQHIYSNITVGVLIITGIGIALYFVILRDRLLSRCVVFAITGGVYAYVLSPELRASMHQWTSMFGYTGEFLESLKIYPILPIEKIHFLEYGLLGFLFCKTLSFHIKDKLVYPLTIISVYIVGLLDEGIQWALPNRVGEYRDIWLNLLAGTLVVMLVWLVLRPRTFKRHARWSSLRPLLYTVAAAFVLTGIFLQLVHGFGRPIFLPDSGTQFVSVFSEYRLLNIDKIHRQRLDGELVEEIPMLDFRKFQEEAWAHVYFRDWYADHDKYWKSYCEQEILKTYYRSYLQQHQISLIEYDRTQFSISPEYEDYIFYESGAQQLAITVYSSYAMWTFISISAPLSALCATFCLHPVNLRDTSLVQKPRRRWFELGVLRTLFAALLVVVVVRAWLPEEKKAEPLYPNVIILTVDSCQPDYWGAYGYDKNTTPFFDVLASEGVLFTNAIVPTSWTIPSLASMLTGLNPNVHGIDVRAKLMDPRIPTLFEALEEHGYAIGDTSYTLTEPSINSVFKKLEISPEVALSEGRSEESYLLSWMEDHKDEPFFGWVHFHTSHLPYKATPPYDHMFLEDIDPEVLADEQIRFIHSNIIVRKGEVAFDAERHTPAIHALYAQTLRQQDAKIGKVLMKLDELGLRENTLLIITADHGDELMEHGFIGHASTNWDSTMYDDLVQVPLLIVYPPTLPQGKRIDTQVRMIDIMPTVLDIANIPFTAPIQGKSIVPLMTQGAEFQETAYSESTPCGYSCPKKLVNNRLRSVRTNDWKFITVYDDDSGEISEELYNLRKDPAEQHNVVTNHPFIASLYRYEMQRWMDAPSQFPYQVIKSEEEHYLDVDVEVRPIVLFPKVGTVVSPKTHNNRVYLEWTGDPQAEYLIEYDVGKAGYHMTGELDAVGIKQWYGPFPEDIWQALPLYNPWKFRVIPKKYPDYPSDWITFEMKYE